jgi:hypothetical protein
MGGKGSKLDKQEAVALCRGRADLLAAAVRHRYALADSHDALAESLASAAAALHRLMTAPWPPPLELPAARKGADAPTPTAAAASPPHSSSHINFAPSSDSESGSVTSSPPRRVVAAGHDPLPPHPLPYLHYGYAGYGYAPEEAPYSGGYPPPGSLRLFYARSRPPPASVAVEQRAAPSERVYYGSFDPQYHSYGAEPAPPVAGRAPPPPPSPPRSSSWDFFNVFGDYDVYDNYCYDAGSGTGAAASAYTPSRTSREMREEEGIPELEEDDAVVKQVAGDHSAPGSGARSRRSSLGGVSSSIAEVDEDENSVVDKEVIGGGSVARHQAPAQRNVAASAPTPRRTVNTSDVAGEIKAQFDRAADAVRALSPILEVGRRRYNHRSSVYHGEPFVLPILSTVFIRIAYSQILWFDLLKFGNSFLSCGVSDCLATFGHSRRRALGCWR